MSYDSKCYDLASWFLSDEPTLATDARRCELAKQIQDTIEGYIAVAHLEVDPLPDFSNPNRMPKDGDSAEGDLTGTT